jgi:hypothetical protein
MPYNKITRVWFLNQRSSQIAAAQYGAAGSLARSYWRVLASIWISPLGFAYSVKCACAIIQFALALLNNAIFRNFSKGSSLQNAVHSVTDYSFGNRKLFGDQMFHRCVKLQNGGQNQYFGTFSCCRPLSFLSSPYMIVNGNANQMLHTYTPGEMSGSLFCGCYSK